LHIFLHSDEDDSFIYSELMRLHRCWELMPNSSMVVLLDIELKVGSWHLFTQPRVTIINCAKLSTVARSFAPTATGLVYHQTWLLLHSLCWPPGCSTRAAWIASYVLQPALLSAHKFDNISSYMHDLFHADPLLYECSELYRVYDNFLRLETGAAC